MTGQQIADELILWQVNCRCVCVCVCVCVQLTHSAYAPPIPDIEPTEDRRIEVQTLNYTFPGN